MVKITNGVIETVVSKGAFDGIFSHQGFRLVDDNINTNEDNENASELKSELQESASEDEIDDSEHIEEPRPKDDSPEWVKELLEKPIASWNKEQIKKYAAQFGIDISGTKNANEARTIIKNSMAAE